LYHQRSHLRRARPLCCARVRQASRDPRNVRHASLLRREIEARRRCCCSSGAHGHAGAAAVRAQAGGGVPGRAGDAPLLPPRQDPASAAVRLAGADRWSRPAAAAPAGRSPSTTEAQLSNTSLAAQAFRFRHALVETRTSIQSADAISPVYFSAPNV
jgi:hypothetical protein